MSGHVARCLGCGRPLEGVVEGQWVKWTLSFRSAEEAVAKSVMGAELQQVKDFVCGDCLRETVLAATGRKGERIAHYECGGDPAGCEGCEGGLVFLRDTMPGDRKE